VLYVNKQEFSASSWRSNKGYTKMHGQPTIKIHFNIILPPTHMDSIWSVLSEFPDSKYMPVFCPTRATCLAHFNPFHLL